MNFSKADLQREYIQCKLDPVYYGKTFCEIFDQTLKKTVKLELMPHQVRLSRSLQTNRFNIAHKYRQAGISTAAALYSAAKVLFADPSKPERILIVANKLETAQETYEKIIHFIDCKPDWLPITFLQKNQKKFKLNNGSQVKAVACNKGALRGYTPTLLIIDEAAEIENGEEFYTAARPALATGGSCLMIATPNGRDLLYYETYKKAQTKENDYTIVSMKWYQDPRYTRDVHTGKYDLTWKKKVVGENGQVQILSLVEKDFEKQLQLEKEGWRPTSSWFEAEKKGLGGDLRKIAQEYEGVFLGSGMNWISEEYLQYHENTNVCEPIRKEGREGEIWVWEDPIENRFYTLGSDVAMGNSSDYSTFVIVDNYTGNQVAELKGKMPPDRLALLIHEYGMKYNKALVSIDTGGSYGLPVIRDLLNERYPNIHYSLPKSRFAKADFRDFMKSINGEDKKPGLDTGTYREIILTLLEKEVREDTFKIRSSRLLNELRDFMLINGRPDHNKNSNDDLIFAVSIALFISKDLAFGKQYNEQTLAMLNSYKKDYNNKSDLLGANSPTWSGPQKEKKQIVDSENVWLFR